MLGVHTAQNDIRGFIRSDTETVNLKVAFGLPRHKNQGINYLLPANFYGDEDWPQKYF